MKLKRCSKCRTDKPVTEFNRQRRRADGLMPWCRDCQSAYRRAYWAKNKKHELTQIATYYRAHAEDLKARRRERHRLNPEVNAKYAAARYRENPGKYRRLSQEGKQRFLARTGISQSQAWRLKNPLRSMANVRAYQVRKRDATAERVSYDAIFERDKGLCHICGTSVTLQDVHFDHVVPLSRGGVHAESNINVSHARCNIAKGARLLSELGPKILTRAREAS